MGIHKNIALAFRKSFENYCYQLLIEAYHSSITEKIIQVDWDENDITFELHKHINSNPLRLKLEISTNVEHHLPKETIVKKKGFASKLPRIDLRLSRINSMLEYIYYFEAKNLKEKDSALKRRYINTGIDSFIAKKYKDGSLVGYLVEGNLSKTVRGINFLLEKNKRESEFLTKKTLQKYSNYYESTHRKIETLKHLIFDFSKI
jgi:hypothetical protein